MTGKIPCFADFAANKAAKELISALFQRHRVPHALLIEGEPGCGKRTFAHLIAKAAVCGSPREDADSCCECVPCAKAAQGIHPDITVIAKKDKAQSIPVDAVRSLKSDAYIMPNEAEWRIFIIEEAQFLTPQAENALLKVLEEPPRQVLIILTVPSRDQLLDTVVSRCMPVRLYATDSESGAQAAAKQSERSIEDAKQAVLQAQGNVGRAIQQLDGSSENLAARGAEKLLSSLAGGTRADAVAAIGCFERDKQGLIECLNEFIQLCHRCIRCLVDKNGDERLKAFTSAVSQKDLVHAIETAQKAIGYMGRNVNQAVLGVWLCANIRKQ